jgi:fructose-1,6-bisphosphatase/inositol monophosphatase family enzyme
LNADERSYAALSASRRVRTTERKVRMVRRVKTVRRMGVVRMRWTEINAGQMSVYFRSLSASPLDRTL